MYNKPTKQLSTTDYAVEGEFISADEWNEDQFNKAEPAPDQACMGTGYGPAAQEAQRAANQAAQQQASALNAFNLQRQGFNQGYVDSVLDSIFGRGLF